MEIAEQALINILVCENGYSQVVGGPTRGDALLDFFWFDPTVQSHIGI